jgi:hypothetical protein
VGADITDGWSVVGSREGKSSGTPEEGVSPDEFAGEPASATAAALVVVVVVVVVDVVELPVVFLFDLAAAPLLFASPLAVWSFESFKPFAPATVDALDPETELASSDEPDEAREPDEAILSGGKLESVAESVVEFVADLLLFGAGLRNATISPTTSRATTATVAASMSRERLPGSGLSPISQRDHCPSPCAQFLIESPLNIATSAPHHCSVAPT